MFGLEIINNNLVADLRGWSLRESKGSFIRKIILSYFVMFVWIFTLELPADFIAAASWLSATIDSSDY